MLLDSAAYQRDRMTNYSDAELEAMLADLESDLAQRKESFSGEAPTKVREAVCAFANDLPGHRTAGVVFIGPRDHAGDPSGIAITDELLLQLADIKTDGNILPPPSMTVAKRRLRGAEMAVITVEPSDSPPDAVPGSSAHPHRPPARHRERAGRAHPHREAPRA